jgi:hypothetical protein
MQQLGSEFVSTDSFSRLLIFFKDANGSRQIVSALPVLYPMQILWHCTNLRDHHGINIH